MQRILLVDDEADVQYSFRRILDAPDIELLTAASGEEALRAIPKIKPDLVIMDIRMGGITGLETLRRLRQLDAKLPVIMMTAYGTTQTAIEAMKLGAFDYLLKPFDIPKMKQLVASGLKASRDMKQVVACQPEPEFDDAEVGIVGRSEAMQTVFKWIGQLATSDATALITGESGTGKELVARAIYHHSRRSSEPFLAINCAAIPDNLLESELFGHERGAFTGATNQRIGKFEHCHKGTLFLDEIGEMSLQTQSKILRVLQEGTVERLGGNEPIKVNVRVIAATNRDLERAVANHQFREDLFYRLNVVRIHVPPLRERREDIRLLVSYFLRKQARATQSHLKSVAPEVIEALERHAWAGNVRELENVILRASVVAKGDIVRLDDLPTGIRPGVVESAKVAAQAIPSSTGAESERSSQAIGSRAPTSDIAKQLFEWAREDAKLKVLPAMERLLIIEALKATQGNQVQAARLLGITRATLRKRVDKFGIRQALTIQ